MNLVKLNEVYNLTDSLENGWETKGQVIKEVEGNLRINIYTNKKDTYIGSYNYDVLINGEVRVSIASVKGEESAYTDYCRSLVDQILQQVKV